MIRMLKGFGLLATALVATALAHVCSRLLFDRSVALWAAVGAAALFAGAWAFGGLFSAEPERSLLCHEDHGPELGRSALHVRGHEPGDREKFEADIVRLREDPDFDESAYRCMGPRRYWAALARFRERDGASW